MKPEGELERLNRLGREAGTRALQQHRMQNSGSGVGQMLGRTDISTGRHAVPLVGRIAVTVLLFIVIRSAVFALSLPYQVELTIAIVIAIEAAWWLFKRRRATRLKGQSVSLQQELHALKQQEFELRYEEARMNGDLDQFEDVKK